VVVRRAAQGIPCCYCHLRPRVVNEALSDIREACRTAAAETCELRCVGRDVEIMRPKPADRPGQRFEIRVGRIEIVLYPPAHCEASYLRVSQRRRRAAAGEAALQHIATFERAEYAGSRSEWADRR